MFWAVLSVRVCVCVKVEVKGKYVRVETTRLKNLGGVESGGRLLLSYAVDGGSAVCKFQHHCFPIWCVIVLLP